jgi:hypothetical protein
MEENREMRDFGSAGDGGVGVADKARDALEEVRDRASDGWGWVRQNPWPAIGALVGIGILIAWQRRTDPKRRMAHMDADHAVGHTRSFHPAGTDDVAIGMSRSTYVT